MSHGDIPNTSHYQHPPPYRLSGTRQRVSMHAAAGELYWAMLSSDLDLTLEGLERLAGPQVGVALFGLMDACHVTIDC